MWALTQEEMEAVVVEHNQACYPCDLSLVEAGAKAQLKKMVKLMRELQYLSINIGTKEDWKALEKEG